MSRSIIEKMTKDGDYNLESNIAKMQKRLLKLKSEKLAKETKLSSLKLQADKLNDEINELSGRVEELSFAYGFLDSAAKEWGFRGMSIETSSLDPSKEKQKTKFVEKGNEIEERVAKNLCTRFNRDTKKYCSRKMTTKAQKAAKLCKVCLKEFS